MNQTSPKLDLGNASHASRLLEWLNKWNCRIAKGRFSELLPKLRKWSSEEGRELPSVDVDIAGLEEFDFVRLTRAFEALRSLGLGPSAAAKTLFAVRPKCAIPWDGPIRITFGLKDDCGGYRGMLDRSSGEASLLVEEAGRHEISNILKEVGSGRQSPEDSPDRLMTLARTLDEYHWITITAGHRIPFPGELERWITWQAMR